MFFKKKEEINEITEIDLLKKIGAVNYLKIKGYEILKETGYYGSICVFVKKYGFMQEIYYHYNGEAWFMDKFNMMNDEIERLDQLRRDLEKIKAIELQDGEKQ